MREGRTYKRCTVCGAAIPDRECTKVRDGERCGSRSYTWSFVVDVAPPGAPRQQKRGGGFPTKAKAVEEMNDLQQAYSNGTAVEPSKLTVRQYLTAWLEQSKPPNAPRGRKPLRPSTWEERRSRINNYVVPRIGDVPLQSLNELTLEALYRELETSGKVRGGGGLARSTVHGIHLAIHAALEDALHRRPAPLVQRNVSDGLYSAPTSPEDEVATWNPDELGAFLRHVAEDELFAFWRLAAMTGARRGELLGLRWRDIDLTAGTVTINRARTKGIDGQVETGKPKSSRSRRTIDIDAVTVETLAAHRKAQDVLSIDGLVFTYSDGKPLHPDGVTQRFDRHVRDSGLPRITLKGLRHTHATLLLLRGVPLHVVSRRLGHANEAFTARVYSHVLPGQDGDAVAGLASIIDTDRKAAQ